MSKFLESLVRSAAKSCTRKIKFPKEDSAIRSAADMMRKKKERFGTNEVFEPYKCVYCEGWHIGHRTNFDWIPPAHTSYTLMIVQYMCFGKCNGKSTTFYTNTVVSNRIMQRFPDIQVIPEVGTECPVCDSYICTELKRKFIPLIDIAPDSTETLDQLWNR